MRSEMARLYHDGQIPLCAYGQPLPEPHTGARRDGGADQEWKGGRKVSPYLFVDEYGHFIQPDTFTKHLRKIFRENDFPESFHLHT